MAPTQMFKSLVAFQVGFLFMKFGFCDRLSVLTSSYVHIRNLIIRINFRKIPVPAVFAS